MEKGYQDAQYVVAELMETFGEGDIFAIILSVLLFPFRYIIAWVY